MESQYFIFDNIKSIDMDLHLIRMDSGLVETPLFGGQDIIEDQVPRRDVPYFYGVRRNPIEFTVEFSPLEKQWTPEMRNRIASWLFSDKYKSFQTCDDLGKLYYAICTNPSNLFITNSRGYSELTFRTNAPYAWTTPYTDEWNLYDNVTTKIIEIDNLSNISNKFYPDIEVELLDNTTGFLLKNLSNGGVVTSFNNLNVNETISIDNKNKIVLSNKPLSNPFSKFNKKWFYLVKGKNYIEITGKVNLTIRCQFPIIQ